MKKETTYDDVREYVESKKSITILQLQHKFSFGYDIAREYLRLFASRGIVIFKKELNCFKVCKN